MDAFLQCNGNTLLLSEREANGILPYLQDTDSETLTQNPGHIRFMHLAYAKLSLETSSAVQPSPYPIHPTSFIPEKVDPTLIAILQLFNGETTYSKQVRTALVALLDTIESRTAARGIPKLRGKESMLARSDLDEVCTSHRAIEI